MEAAEWSAATGKIHIGLCRASFGIRESEERRRTAAETGRRKEAERDRVFGMDFLITHGSAFGGCAAVCADGTIRKDKVALDNILMYGKHPSGKEFTYYIEDQGLEICACDNPEELTVISKQQPFEIREAGLSRGQGVPTKQAVIKQDVKYYIILESKHEISIKATKRC